MRITGGTFKGRTVVSPKTTATRPMTDKVRAALFDILGDIEGTLMVDAYAGSGAVGIEALSRGAAQVIGIESARPAIQALTINLKTIGISWGYSLYTATVESWLARPDTIKDQAFDLIIADPPYAQLKLDVLEKLGGLLRPTGWLIVSHSSRGPALNLQGLTLDRRKTYGDTALGFYKLI